MLLDKYMNVQQTRKKQRKYHQELAEASFIDCQAHTTKNSITGSNIDSDTDNETLHRSAATLASSIAEAVTTASPMIDTTMQHRNTLDNTSDYDEVFECDEHELQHRRLHMFAACALQLTSASPSPPPSLTSSSLSSSSANCNPLQTTLHANDPVYLDDDDIFVNLVLRERASQLVDLVSKESRPSHSAAPTTPLCGQTRHSLLSWMLRVCEQELCQDEIFPLASMILDKYLYVQMREEQFQQQQQQQQQNSPKHSTEINDHDMQHHLNSLTDSASTFASSSSSNQQLLDCSQTSDYDEVFECDEQELEHRRLYMFAACALLLATKFRQTPRLSVHTLIKFSRNELSVELARDEILSGEMIMLAALNWDLAAFVTPNDYLPLVLSKCQHLLTMSAQVKTTTTTTHDHAIGHTPSECKMSTYNNDNSNDFGYDDDECYLGNDTTASNNSNKSSEQQQRRADAQIAAADIAKHKCNAARVKRHTQTLLELCLMGK